MRAKHNQRFREVFLGDQDFFDPQIVLSAAKGNFMFSCLINLRPQGVSFRCLSKKNMMK
jgi:hypothetical protein